MIIVHYMADHIYKTKVYYEDTDAGGIVYYARYLHFIERARTEMIYDYFKLNHRQLRDQFNAIFVVRECNVKYLKSANFEDHLQVKTKVIKKSPVRLNLLQEVSRDNETLVTAVTSVSLSLETSCNKLSLTGDFFITFVLTCRWSSKFADFKYLTLHSLTTKIALN